MMLWTAPPPANGCQGSVVRLTLPRFGGANLQTVTTIGLDIAKSVFQMHGIDAEGKVLIRRKLKRRYVLAFFERLPPCLVGIEACATSHHSSRELKSLGRTVRLMPPAFLTSSDRRTMPLMPRPSVKRWTRANMRFVETKTPEQGAA